MFSTRANASKAALITLVTRLREHHFDLIDCQVETPHLGSLGARLIPRREFSVLLKESLRHETFRGDWGTLNASSLLWASVQC
jgi:leucyl/phenylalanyl-tRNA--protein transferase